MDNDNLVSLSVRVPASVRDRLVSASRTETRALSHQARRYIEIGLAADGYVDDGPSEPEPKRAA